MNEPYRVDYHVIQVIYFSQEHLLTGPEFARVWSAMSIFGKEKVVGAFWKRRGYEFSSSKEARFPLGSLEYVEPLLDGSDPIYGGGTFAKRNVARGPIEDCDFYFTHCDQSRWEGKDTLPEFNLAISGKWYERLGSAASLTRFKEHFEIADRHAPPYGLVDVAAPGDAWAGMVYGSLWMMRAPLHRWVEQGNWVYSASQKGDRARGIYWGNYFGPKLLMRLGGRDDFVRRYREQARLADGSPNAHIWEFTNGVFLSLCLDPLSCRPGEPMDMAAMFNLEWLTNELGVKGALNAWDEADASTAESARLHPAACLPSGSETSSECSGTVSELNEAEWEWIEGCVAQGRALVQTYGQGEDMAVLNPRALDGAFAGWLVKWDAGEAKEDPNVVVNGIGLAFGQWLVEHLGMRWAVITDATGTDMGVIFGPNDERIQVFPTHVVAKRLEAREIGFLARVFEITKLQVATLRGSGAEK